MDNLVDICTVLYEVDNGESVTALDTLEDSVDISYEQETANE